ncbi:MAG: YceI family protein [Gammaproteobacteria bacterium]
MIARREAPSTFIATLALFALPLTTGAQQIDYGRSQITVTSRQMNVPVQAKFTKFSGQLAFDPATPGAITARVEVDAASFDVGNDDVNIEALDKDWLDAKKFPKATFVSSSVRTLGGGRYEALGPLTIKGRTLDVTVPFAVKTDAAGNSVLEGAFNIRRLQYSIGEGVWRHVDVVTDDVQIRFRFYTSSKPPLK